MRERHDVMKLESATLRAALAEDVQAIFETIGYWAAHGKMLVRPMPNIFENLRDFFVAEIDGVLSAFVTAPVTR